MTEFSLIREFLDLETQINNFRAEQKEEDKYDLYQLRERRNILSVRLINTADKSFSLTAHKTIKKQISEYIRIFESFGIDEKIDRNTSIHVPDYLFTMLLEDIFKLISKENNSWITVPANICSTTKKELGVSPQDLILFLKNELLLLEKTDSIDFNLIYEYYQGFKKRLETSFFI